jgi:hypothetical protein
LMPRDCGSPADGCCGGGSGLAAVKWRMPAGTLLSCRVDTIAPGSRRRPPRLGLMRVQRGNPVEVQARMPVAGRPSVSGAELLGGNRMVQQAKAGVPKGDGKAAQQDRSFGGRVV